MCVCERYRGVRYEIEIEEYYRRNYAKTVNTLNLVWRSLQHAYFFIFFLFFLQPEGLFTTPILLSDRLLAFLIEFLRDFDR